VNPRVVSKRVRIRWLKSRKSEGVWIRWAGYSAVDKDAVCAGCVDQRRGAFDGWMD